MVTAVVRRASFHSISFVARPLQPSWQVALVTPVPELTTRGSYILTFTTERVK